MKKNETKKERESNFGTKCLAMGRFFYLSERCQNDVKILRY